MVDKAVILAAGEGVRLRPFTVTEPKVMVKVANLPILEYVVKALVANHVSEIVIVVGYKKERIMSYFEDGKHFNARISYVTEERQLGTGHALLSVEEKVSGSFLVLPGDNIIDARLIGDLLSAPKQPVLAVTESAALSKYGVVDFVGGHIKNVSLKAVKAHSDLISTGIFTVTPEIFEYIKKSAQDGSYDLMDALNMYVRHHQMSGVVTRGLWMDAVYPWNLVTVNTSALTFVKGGAAGTIEKGVTLKGPVTIEEGSIIRAGCHITGPVTIGKGCDIGPYTVITPSTSIGDNVCIGPFCYVKQSLIMDDVKISSYSHLEDSVLGDGIKIGSHFTAISGDGDIKLETKFHSVEGIGALIGEDTEISSKVTSLPVTLVGSQCNVAPQKTISGNIKSGSIII